MAKAEAASFETEWRALAPIVERTLASRGVPKWLRDDLLQETALRLYRSWDNVDPDRSPVGLAVTIANNALWDERNRRRVVELPGALPETASSDDVEDAGIARLELHRVGSLLSRLSPAHRSVLLAEVGHGSVPEGSKAATKMLRMRARRKMRSLLDAVSAGVFAAITPRALWRTLRTTRRDALIAVAPTAVVAACGMVVLLDTGSPLLPYRLETLNQQSAVRQESRDDPSRALAAGGAVALSRDRDRGGFRSRPQQQPPPEHGSYWQIGVGDDETPVTGGAGLGISPDPNGEDPRPPECSASQPGEGEAEVTCSASAGGQKYEATVKVQIRP